MIRTTLTEAQRSELQALRRTDLPAVARDRLEMILLSAAGWSPPRIGEHLGRHPHTVRATLKGYAARGTQAFDPDTPGPEPNHDRRAKVTRSCSAKTEPGPVGNWPRPSAPTSASATARPAATSPC